MAALEEAEGFEVGGCDHIVGTSAGSVLAALARRRRQGRGPARRPARARGPAGSARRLHLRPRPRHRWRAAERAAAADGLDEAADASGPAPAFRDAAGRRVVVAAHRARQPVDRPPPGRRDQPDRAVVAAPGRLGGRDGLRQRPPGGVRPAGRAGGRARRGGARVLLDPGLVRAGHHRRPPVHRRRHLLAHLPGPARRPGPGRGVRARADVLLRLRRARLGRGPGGALRSAARSPGGWCARQAGSAPVARR